MSPQPETTSPSNRPKKVRRAAGDEAMQRATLAALVVGVLLDAVVIAFAVSQGSGPALWGALIGTGLTLVMVLPTVGITFLGKRLTPVSMAATVLGSWGGKMLIVILVLVGVQNLEAVSTRWIGLALLVGAISAVIVEAVLLARARQPLVIDSPQNAEEDGNPREGA